MTGRGRSAFRVAAVLSALWALAVIAYAVGFFAGGGAPAAPGLAALLFLLAIAAPVALFLLAARLADRADSLGRETGRLADALEAFEPPRDPKPVASDAELIGALKRIEATLAETRAAVALLSETRREEGSAPPPASETPAPAVAKPAPPPAAAAETPPPAEEPADDGAQPTLPLGEDVATPPAIPWTDVVGALNFPRDESDKSGFALLEKVVRDRDFAELLQAAEDALSMLAQDGLFMEDVKVDHASLEHWRRYIEGERGAKASAIGGVRDEIAIGIAQGRTKNDPVFRDTALHFLRRFDRLMERAWRELGADPLLLEIADTRTGRGFMIVARALGVFE